MKYQNTSRTLSFLAHALIALLFGLLGLYFGIFVVPWYFLPSTARTGIVEWFWENALFNGSFLLYLELAVIGLSMATISGYGLYHSIKALQNPRDDAPVVKSFTVLIVEGWIMGIFFLLQAALYFDLTGNTGSTKDNLVFVIVMGILFALILLIATNIPMVKLYDGKDQKPLLKEMVGGVMVVTGFTAIESAIALIANATNSSLNPWKQGEINWLLAVVVAMNLAAVVLTAIAYFAVFNKNGKLAAYLAGFAVLALGAGLIAYGVLSIVWRDDCIHLNYIGDLGAYKFGDKYGYGFMIMNLVVGAITLGLGGGVIAAAKKGEQK